MKLTQLFPDLEVIAALEQEELGLRLLPWIAQFPGGNRQLAWALREIGESYPGPKQSEIAIAIREAWAWLEGAALLIESPAFVGPNQIRILSRKAIALAATPERARIVNSRLLPKDILHPSIRENVWALFHRGKLDTAVFEAMKAVEVAVRSASGLSAKDVGVGLMRRAFDADNGPLSDMNVERSEREARAHLFAGAIGSYKNPHSHRNVMLDDASEAAEILLIANHLLRIVDSRCTEQSKIQR